MIKITVKEGSFLYITKREYLKTKYGTKRGNGARWCAPPITQGKEFRDYPCESVLKSHTEMAFNYTFFQL